MSDPDTINRLIGGADKPLLAEMTAIYNQHYRSDLIVDLAKTYPDQNEYISHVTSWITQPGLPF